MVISFRCSESANLTWILALLLITFTPIQVYGQSASGIASHILLARFFSISRNSSPRLAQFSLLQRKT
jgi:hypothetical protein